MTDRERIRQIVTKAVAGTKDLTEAIDELHYMVDSNKFHYIFWFDKFNNSHPDEVTKILDNINEDIYKYGQNKA